MIDKHNAGMSNRLMALASGVALAMVTERIPIVPWESGLFSDLFGRCVWSYYTSANLIEVCSLFDSFPFFPIILSLCIRAGNKPRHS